MTKEITLALLLQRTLPERDFKRIKIPLDGKGCWLWTGGKDNGGYGVIIKGGEKMGAHRYIYFRSNPTNNLELHILHTCDVPSCVNPLHLWQGTHQENVADMIQKGRHTWQKEGKWVSAKNNKIVPI